MIVAGYGWGRGTGRTLQTRHECMNPYLPSENRFREVLWKEYFCWSDPGEPGQVCHRLCSRWVRDIKIDFGIEHTPFVNDVQLIGGY